MSLVKYNDGFVERFPTAFDGLLNRFFNDNAFNNTQVERFSPSVDVLESEKTYKLHLAVPGFNKDNFNMNVEDNMLVVSGERKFEDKKSEKTFKSVQTSYGAFRRSFRLPENVDVSKIDAKYIDGMLEVIIPKDEAKTLKTTIKIK